MDKEIIAGNFSKNADSYDAHSAVQTRCAEKLLKQLKRKDFPRILEIGCGTGSYTRLLRGKYKNSEILAVDISPDMVRFARKKLTDENIKFKVADGEKIQEEENFDLITSNASFQWFEDLEMTLEIFKNKLEDNGVLCFSMYGPDTFSEFKEVLGEHFGRRRWLSSSRFVTRGQIERVLEKHFKKFKLTEKHFSVDFFSLWDFLQDIKHSGTRGEGLSSSVFLGKYAIKEMELTYIEKFGSIVATHHVYFCEAMKQG